MTKTYTIIHDEIVEALQELNKMEVGTDTYKIAVDGLTKLIDREIEIRKLEQERQEAVERREHDAELKKMELKAESNDRLRKDILTGLGIAVPAGCGIWAFIKSMKFEETGTITTDGGKAALKGLLGFFTKWVR